MKAAFANFIKENPNCKGFARNPEAKQIFEEILSKDENIIAMIDVSANRKPAISAVVNEIEDFYISSQPNLFDLTDSVVKQALGRMVTSVLRPFGYVVKRRRYLPKVCTSKFITSGRIYAKDGPATMRVVRKIEKI
jgi:hypothetical protein